MSDTRVAAIDCGTNSIRLLVADPPTEPGGELVDLARRMEIVRLGQGVDRTGRLAPEAIERTRVALAEYAAQIGALGADRVRMVATSATRDATNAADFRDMVRATLGVDPEVITGAEEARLSYLAATSALDLGEGSLVVFETGGGSSQFTFGDGARVDEQFSVPVGAVRFTEQFGLDKAVSRETVDEARAAIAADLSRIDGRPSPSALVGMGGAITNLTAVKHGLATYDPDVVQGTILDRAEVDRQIELYRSRDADGRREIVGLQPKRAEVILAGACVVRTVLEMLGKDSLTVSDRGLRHGLLVERFGPVEASR